MVKTGVTAEIMQESFVGNVVDGEEHDRTRL